jgi:hypothetical protein
MAMQPHWRGLEAEADRPEIQELIRREIRRGTIRVVPAPEGTIRIIPALDLAADRESRLRMPA